MSELTEKLHLILDQQEKLFLKENGNWYSTSRLKKDMAAALFHLEQAGLKPGDNVLLGLPNSYRFVVLYLAVIEYGAAIVAMDPDMPKPEFYQFLERSGSVIAIVNQKLANYLLQDMPQNCQLQSIFVLELSEPELQWYCIRQSSWMNDFLKTEIFDFCPHEPKEDSVAVILYTSGTTGKPKAVGLTHRQVLASVHNIIRAHELGPADITYGFLPLFHINAQVIVLLSTCISNGRLVLEHKFSASKFWGTIFEEGITWVSAVPTVIAILNNTKVPDQIPQSLRFIRSASAKLQISHAKMFEQKFHIPLIESYGMTEAASQICINPLPPQKRKLGSVGLPVGLELQIMEDDKPLLPFETGEIVIRGNNVIQKYLQAEKEEDFRGGWLYTGDIGYKDEEGYVFIIGRRKELINHGGEKISPYEVEEVICQLPEIQQAAVIGLPDQLYGERVMAFAIAVQDYAGKEKELKLKVLEQCRMNLSGYKCPQEIFIVDKLPLGPTGKLLRKQLAQTYQEFKSE